MNEIVKTNNSPVAQLGGSSTGEVDVPPQTFEVEQRSYSTSDAGEVFTIGHPVLNPMRVTCEHMFDADDFVLPFPVLNALVVQKGRRTFWQPAAHEHFATEAKRQRTRL